MKLTDQEIKNKVRQALGFAYLRNLPDDIKGDV